MSRSLASSNVGGATWLNRHATTRVNAAWSPIGPTVGPASTAANRAIGIITT